MLLTPGMPAPQFTVFDSERQEISLSSLKGQKVLLLFYPAAFTSTCTKELCSVRDELSYYNNLNAKVIAISTDALYALHAYKKEQNYNFTLASDFNKEVCGLYGAQYEVFNFGMIGVAKRAAFVIDEQGIIKYAEVMESAGDLPDFVKIKTALQ